MMFQKIAFQGYKGAYSDMVCRHLYPNAQSVPCHDFMQAFDLLKSHDVDAAVIPIDNSLAGRVADVHALMPDSGFFIMGEYFLPVHHALLCLPDADESDLKTVHSHVHALPQCRKIIRAMNLTPIVEADTAGAAKFVAERGDKSQCAIASTLAAEEYGLKILKTHVQDTEYNITRFVVFSNAPYSGARTDQMMTSFVFRVRNLPAALYKALGGFATNGINMTKIESYVDEYFNVAAFYCEVEGHIEDQSLKNALEELQFFTEKVTLFGSYPADAFRKHRKD
jgi:prephenate dehydratase